MENLSGSVEINKKQKTSGVSRNFPPRKRNNKLIALAILIVLNIVVGVVFLVVRYRKTNSASTQTPNLSTNMSTTSDTNDQDQVTSPEDVVVGFLEASRKSDYPRVSLFIRDDVYEEFKNFAEGNTEDSIYGKQFTYEIKEITIEEPHKIVSYIRVWINFPNKGRRSYVFSLILKNNEWKVIDHELIESYEADMQADVQ